MNKQAFQLTGVTEKDYLDWCKKNKKGKTSLKSKTEFFGRIEDGRLRKNSDNELVRKNK